MYAYSKKYTRSKSSFIVRQRDFCGSCGKHNLLYRGYYIDTPKGRKKSCSECLESYTRRLKNEYLVESYNNREIYFVEDLYLTSWMSSYGFSTLEKAKEWIDSKCIMLGI